MSDFSASIEAILDTKKAEQQLSSLQNKKINLEVELTGKNFNVNDLLKNVQTQMKAGGTAAANAFSDSINKINVSNAKAQIENMRKTLSSMKFDNAGIETLTKHLDQINLKISEVKTNLRGNGTDLDVTVKGTDELGRTVALLERYDSETGEITRLNEQISQSFDKMARAEANAAKEQEKFNQTQIKASTLSNKMTAWTNQNTKAAEEYGGEIQALQKQLNTDNLSPGGYSRIALQFQEIQAKAKAAGLSTNVFAQELKNAAKQALGLGSAAMVLQKIIAIFKEMYQNLYDIDTAMTNLFKVTDETDAKYASFLKNVKKDAQDLGRTVSSLIEQTSTWAKLGYSIDESAELAKVSSVYANVGEVSDATAVSDMVTAMKAFKIEAKDALIIVDSLNELSNNFATDAAALGSGLAKSASTLQLAGASPNETLAMLTGGAEITQNANEFGNFIKVAAMRVRGMKGELEELGEEVDENVDSISKVQTQILNLTHGKVNIFDDNGDFRNFYNVMQDIANVFDKLKSTEQADLSEILFGKVRGNQGAALIQAFQSGQVQKALDTANNSAGSAAAEQAKWMESLEAKTNAFKAAWQGLSESFLNSDFLKGAIDSGTVFLNILTKITDKAGTLPMLITAATAALSLTKNIGRDKTFSYVVVNMPIAIEFCRTRQFRYRSR